MRQKKLIIPFVISTLALFFFSAYSCSQQVVLSGTGVAPLQVLISEN